MHQLEISTTSHNRLCSYGNSWVLNVESQGIIGVPIFEETRFLTLLHLLLNSLFGMWLEFYRNFVLLLRYRLYSTKKRMRLTKESLCLIIEKSFTNCLPSVSDQEKRFIKTISQRLPITTPSKTLHLNPIQVMYYTIVSCFLS